MHTKNKIVVISFCAIIGAMALLNFFSKDTEISFFERRQLAQRPTLNAEFIFSGEAGTKLEEYCLDQFWKRDEFRSLKTRFDLRAFLKKDTSGLYVVGNHIFKSEYPLKEDSVKKAAAKMKEIQSLYLQNNKVAFAVIPDKSYYVSEPKHLKIDYKQMVNLLKEELPSFHYIPLNEALSLEDYYETDLHWKQENLGGVLSQIGTAFQMPFQFQPSRYESKTYDKFYGAYYGQLGQKRKPDRLTYLSNDIINSLVVTDYDESKKTGNVIYDESELGGVDSYELFFSGNSPLITIENRRVNTMKEIIVFRDSFASSLAPLLAEGYSKVTLIDLRFMGYDHLKEFVEFGDSDVLFLFGQSVYNTSDMIRKN